jgi:hypothetical protein
MRSFPFVALNRFAVLPFAALALLGAPCAEATCGSAACFLVTQTSEGTAARGAVTVDLSVQFVNQDRRLSGSHEVGEVLTPGVDIEGGELELDHHREIQTRSTFVKADVVYGVSDRLSLTASLPLWSHKDHDHFADVGTPDEHFNGAAGTKGFGDVVAGLRYALVVRPRDLLVGSLAVKLPTGRYRLLDEEGKINEPTIQPGTGSTDGLASLYYSRSELPGGIEAFADASYRANRENPLDYEIGDEIVAGIGASRQIGNRLHGSLQVNARRTGRDRFLGGEVPSTGSTYVNVTPGFRFRTGSGATVYGLVQLPVHQHVNEDQLAPRIGLLAGVSRTF